MPENNKTDHLLQEIWRELRIARRPRVPSVPQMLRERGAESSVDYINEERRLDTAQICARKEEARAAALAAISIDGVVAEFGVHQGVSLTQIAGALPDRTVHAFDSFIGLPESWSGTSKGEGAFDVGGKPPELDVTNVEFHVGFFDTTVPPFAQAHEGPFSFVHLDADLYSSTKTVMDELHDWFVPGTVIVFDEYFGYHGWQHHEHRAFMELLESSGLSFQGVSIGHMNLGVKLTAG